MIFLVGLALVNFLWIRGTLVYGLLAIGLWLAIMAAGVHATVAGDTGGSIHPGLSFPRTEIAAIILSPLTMGIMFGLLVGKPLGITLFSYLAVKSGLASLPRGLNWLHIAGAGMLGELGLPCPFSLWA